MRFLRGTVFTLGLAGALLFGGAWLTSLIAPQWVEQIGRELVRQEVERRVGEKLDVLDRSTLVGLARRLGGEQAQRLHMRLQVHDLVLEAAHAAPR